METNYSEKAKTLASGLGLNVAELGPTKEAPIVNGNYMWKIVNIELKASKSTGKTAGSKQLNVWVKPVDANGEVVKFITVFPRITLPFATETYKPEGRAVSMNFQQIRNLLIGAGKATAENALETALEYLEAIRDGKADGSELKGQTVYGTYTETENKQGGDAFVDVRFSATKLDNLLTERTSMFRNAAVAMPAGSDQESPF